jgi:hypothetical protein
MRANGFGRRFLRVAEGSLLPICVFALALALPYNITGDGAARYAALDTLLRHGALSASRYSLVGPIFATPLYLLGAALGNAQGGVIFFNIITFILGLVAFSLLMRRVLDPRTLRSFLLLLTVASTFPAALETFYGEPFTAIMVGLGLAAALLSARRTARVAGWVAVALGVANTPATLLALALTLVERLWSARRLRYILVGAGAVALVASESLARRGTVVATGYLADAGSKTLSPYSDLTGFSYPIFFGLLAILFSFGKGLIYYTPGLFLPLWSRLRALGERGAALARLHNAWLLFTAGLILAYASWWGWHGDWFWGPRFFLFASIPASFALAIRASQPSSRLWVNALTLLAVALAVWVGIDSAVFNVAGLSVCEVNNGVNRVYCEYTPELSALWRPFELAAQYGLGSAFAQAEYFQSRAALFLICAPLAGLYIAAPLLRVTANQTRELVVALWPRALKLRAGWRW